MLVLKRNVGECVNVGDDVVVKVLELRQSTVVLGFEAPRNVVIRRSEVEDLREKCSQALQTGATTAV